MLVFIPHSNEFCRFLSQEYEKICHAVASKVKSSWVRSMKRNLILAEATLQLIFWTSSLFPLTLITEGSSPLPPTNLECVGFWGDIYCDSFKNSHGLVMPSLKTSSHIFYDDKAFHQFRRKRRGGKIHPQNCNIAPSVPCGTLKSPHCPYL